MHLQTYRLQSILNSGPVFEQSSSFLSPRAVHRLIYLSPSCLLNLQKVFVQVNLHVGLKFEVHFVVFFTAKSYIQNNPGTIFFFLISKRSASFDLLVFFVTIKFLEGLLSSQLECRDGYDEYSHNVNLKRLDDEQCIVDLLECFLTTNFPEGLRASQLACRVVLFFQNSGDWWLFRNETLASSKDPEALVYSSDFIQRQLRLVL
uniref:Uncharacterized protein n=1 Tax=Solanum lycopersicum TaxID=4081 RepID=A0A3Q7JL65_SOLLC